MRLRTLAGLLWSGEFPLMMKILRASNEFYRACFVTAALSEGLYEKLKEGSVSFDHLSQGLNSDYSREGLRAWLNLGVSLRELRYSAKGYSIKGTLSKKLARCRNDTYQALLQEIVQHHYRYVLQTPSVLREQKRFPFDEIPGELIARSSRVIEPFLFEVVDESVPRTGPFRLLEVGCGSGIYIRRSCERNSSLTAVGLELQPQVAEFARTNIKAWGLEHRVDIEVSDVRAYLAEPEFDLVTLHQNIYYFPVEERVALAKHLGQYLKPGGRLLLSTACQGGGPGVQALNVWVSTTEGYGPLPYSKQLCAQLKEAGFSEVHCKKLTPLESFYAFFARKPTES